MFTHLSNHLSFGKSVMSKDRDTLRIDLEGYSYTLPEAARVSDVAERNLRNWIDRKVLVVGKRHFSGRWMFNLLDCLRTNVCHDLITRSAIEPKHAAKLASLDRLGLMAHQYASRPGPEITKKMEFKPHEQPPTHLIATFEDGEWLSNSFHPLVLSSWSLRTPKSPRDVFDEHFSRLGNAIGAPFIVVPVWSAIRRIEDRAAIEIERRSAGGDAE
jgi:hypothetical protein